jgi:hypothetical protein
MQLNRSSTVNMEIIARLGRAPHRPERLALIRPDGSVSNWFARDATRDEIAELLARAGLRLTDADTVIRDGSDAP